MHINSVKMIVLSVGGYGKMGTLILLLGEYFGSNIVDSNLEIFLNN